MSHNFSSSLMTVSTPLLVLQANSLSSIQFPRDWCDKSRDLPSCMCQEQHDILVMDISENEEAGYSDNGTRLDAEDDLARLVDWWTEGVVLPSICGIGILGRFYQKVLSLTLFVSGNIASIFVLINKRIDLKPSFVNILICLVSKPWPISS